MERFRAIRIGLTATRSDREGRSTYELFGCATYCYPLRRGIEENYLAPYRIYRAMTRVTKEGVSLNGRRYKPQELEYNVTVPDRNMKMAEEVERVAVEGKTLVYAITKRHASELARCFNQLRPSLGGKYADAITTDNEDPQDAIRRLKEKVYPRIAVSVGMLDTGFDCPKVVNIVFCCPTMSETPYKQIRGRGTRLCDGKESFLMLDFVGNSEYLNEGYAFSRGYATEYEGNVHELDEHMQRKVQTSSEKDAWIRRGWLDVEPGGEAVDLKDLLYGPGPLEARMTNCTEALNHFGRSSVQELAGFFWPEEFPIRNSNISAGLRYLGYEVAPH
ncbi:MAG: helicase-related protein [Thermoplasmata archaeon]